MKALNWRGFPEGQGYFDQLPKLQQAMIKRMVKEAFDDAVGYDMYTKDAEEIECRSRDGFSAHSHNKGGIDVNGYSDLQSFWGSGTEPADEKAAAKIQALIDMSLKQASESFFEKHEALFTKWNLTIDDANYHRMEEIENSPNPEFAGLANEFSELENECLSGDYSSVLYQTRVMYHGESSGIHSMTIFSSISASDAPYHRSTDGIKEILITWKTPQGLKTKLAKALNDSMKAVF